MESFCFKMSNKCFGLPHIDEWGVGALSKGVTLTWGPPFILVINVILTSANGTLMCPFKLTFNTRSHKRIKSFSHSVQRRPNALSISSHNEEIFVFTLKSVGDAKFSPKYAMMMEI